MQIAWSEPAVQDLAALRAYIEKDRPGAARSMVLRIIEAVKQLQEYPHSGRFGRVEGTRELVIAGTHYIVPYRIRENNIEVLRVLHTARKWPEAF
jgi:toxin ParE1/3/4